MSNSLDPKWLDLRKLALRMTTWRSRRCFCEGWLCDGPVYIHHRATSEGGTWKRSGTVGRIMTRTRTIMYGRDKGVQLNGIDDVKTRP